MSIKKYIGDRRFYKTLLIIALPIILQNGITNFVNLLDNIMVGQVGTEQMSGVAIANQLIFVFNLCIFGGVSGAGIFTAQFFGYGDDEGVRQTFRFKLCVCAGITAIFMVVFGVFGNQLISLYLHDTDAASDLAATLYYGRRYLLVMMFGMPAFALTHAYAGTLRETGHTILPMVAGVAAVFINLFFNSVPAFLAEKVVELVYVEPQEVVLFFSASARNFYLGKITQKSAVLHVEVFQVCVSDKHISVPVIRSGYFTFKMKCEFGFGFIENR